MEGSTRSLIAGFDPSMEARLYRRLCRFILPSKGTLNEGLIYRKQAIAMGISHVLSLRFWAP